MLYNYELMCVQRLVISLYQHNVWILFSWTWYLYFWVHIYKLKVLSNSSFCAVILFRLAECCLGLACLYQLLLFVLFLFIKCSIRPKKFLHNKDSEKMLWAMPNNYFHYAMMMTKHLSITNSYYSSTPINI